MSRPTPDLGRASTSAPTPTAPTGPTPPLAFDRHDPPSLTGRSLQAQLEHRRTRRCAALAATAGLLAQTAVALGGIAMLDRFPLAAVACFAYVLVSAVGAGAIGAVFVSQRKVLA